LDDDDADDTVWSKKKGKAKGKGKQKAKASSYTARSAGGNPKVMLISLKAVRGVRVLNIFSLSFAGSFGFEPGQCDLFACFTAPNMAPRPWLIMSTCELLPRLHCAL
jgi:hypothetical protein